MEATSSTVWHRKGSSIIFNKECIGPFISSGALISLREMLSWSERLPPAPPVAGRTIMISGLETIIEIMEPHEAEHFLTQHVRPLLINLQNEWTDLGIVFGFSSHMNNFEEKSFEEEVLFHRLDRRTVRLSESLWDGSSSVNMKRVVYKNDKKEVTIGYYVARIS